MNRDGHKGVDYFIGPEVEHTPAFSKRTLFVVGKQKLDQILRMAKEYRTTHVFMGANHSFNAASEDPYWDQVITALLDKGFWVTLDYQAHEHETVLKMLNPGIWQCRTFVPLLGVRIPKVQTSSPNLTIKIDDVDFKATNPGVWCLHFHEVTDSNRFTDWNEYGTDEVVAPLAGPAEILPVKVPVTAPHSVMEEGLKPEAGTAEKSVEMNPQDLGLDPEPKMTPEVKEVLAASTTTPDQAAEAYAEAGAGAKTAEKKAKKK